MGIGGYRLAPVGLPCPAIAHDSLRAYGWNDRWSALLAELNRPDITPARVVRHDGVALLVMSPDGPASVPLRRSLEQRPVVGDWVAVAEGSVEAVLARQSLLRQRDPDRGEEQPLVANLDAVLVLCGADRPIRTGRIQRFAALAWDAGAPPTIVVSKADLADDLDALVAEASAADPAADVIAVSVVTGLGLDEVRPRVADKTVVLLGESGAGKSRLTNALAEEDVAATGAVRSGDAKGRHTTTSRTLHLLPGGGLLIDTPGVRAVGLSADPDSVSDAFADIDELAEGCRFADCRHEGEPDCAVVEAVADGTLDADRLASWLVLRRESESAALRAEHRNRRR